MNAGERIPDREMREIYGLGDVADAHLIASDLCRTRAAMYAVFRDGYWFFDRSMGSPGNRNVCPLCDGPCIRES
jgi:hypothetical protein